MGLLSTLYPPIVDTYMPAFLINSGDIEKDTCRIYFSISPYNSLEDIENVQVSIRYQNTNTSALNKTDYPSEIMLTTLKIDENKTTKDKYYIEILPSDMEKGTFEINQYYKVQMRFTPVNIPYDEEKGDNPPSLNGSQAIDAWLNSKLNYFSEWSTVCLIRGISKPTIELLNFGLDNYEEIKWTIANTQVIGKISFADENEKEFLKSYQIKLYDENDKMLTDSGILYPENLNSISYNLPYSFEAENSYYFTIEFTTQNLYTEINRFNFEIKQGFVQELDLLMTGEKDPENGRIKIRLRKNNLEDPYTGKIYIRRTSSNSDFTIWEDIHVESFENEKTIDFTWYDYTIESGVWYNYAVQGISDDGLRGGMVKFMRPAMMVFEHMYLTGKDRQLKIAFNPNVSSFKKIVQESKTDTIGSQFPFIRRNGKVGYAQMPVSGLISSETDEDELFTSLSELYGNYEYLYEEYNEINNISSHSDIVLEKKYRDLVEEFLYDGEPKLFRSPTEGCFLVKVMDVSLSPQNTLGRRLWSFNGTMYEIDAFTLDNCEKYNILVERSEK